MHRLKNRGTVVLAVLGLFALSGIAMAESHGEADPGDDTLVNHYIDYDRAFLTLNVTSLDYSPDWNEMFSALEDDCRLVDEGGYSLSFDGSDVTVNDGEGEVELGDCGSFIGGFFYGPNGQTNHGMVMKFLNSIYDGPRRGCVIREFAQIKFNAEDKKQANSGFKPPEPTEATPELFEDVEFMSFSTDCIKDKKGEGRGGPPDRILQKHSGKWGGEGPGKSKSAPGHSNGD